jgi:diguanylate cyclase (GGDEF)-like protein/PAS domain S-box-containing protein
MINRDHIDSSREFSLWLIFMLAGVGLVWVLPAPDAARGLAHYVPLHTSMEVVAIAISAMIFGVCWATQRFHPDGRVLALGVGFLGVGFLDLSHALSNAGMPDFITANSVEKSINFWLMARLFAAVTFLLVAFWPYRLAARIGELPRYSALTAVLALVGIVNYVLLYHSTFVPRTFIEGVGLTGFKVYAEYVLMAMYVIAGIGFLTFSKQHLQSSNFLLALASFTMAMSEFFFTLYANVADVYNVAGHVYKIFAYGFLYRGLFLVTVRSPYLALKDSEAQYVATLDTLPDLLFEVDRKGVYVSVHTSAVEKISASFRSVVGKSIDQVLSPDAARICHEAIAQADEKGISRGHRISVDLPEGQLNFELSVSKKIHPQTNNVTFIVLSRDITETVKNEQRVAFEADLNTVLLELQERDDPERKTEFLIRWVSLTKELLGSPVVLVYAVQGNQNSIELLAGSANFPSNDNAASDSEAIAVDQLGTWATALATGEAIVVNQKITELDTKGLPGQHESLSRYVSLPVLEGGLVRLLVVVGDRPSDYSDEEVNAVKILATTLWTLLVQRRKDAVIKQLSEALEQSPHSVVITDTSARIEYVNKAFCAASGYSPEEVIGQNPRMFQSGETSPLLYQELWRRLKGGESWQGEFTNRSKDGGTYVESVAIYPVLDQFGQHTHYVAHKVDVTHTKAAEQRIRDLSDFDPLTGLLNKKSFDRQLSLAVTEASQRQELLSLLWFNLDNFKLINESLGHEAGDELLIEMAGRLLDSVGTRITVARYSGDTFAVILPRETQSVVAVLAAEILKKLKASVQIASQELSVGASLGIAVFPEDANTPGALASAAEIAMYRAKQEGRNNLRFFSPEMQLNTQRSLDLAVSLNGAHERGELYLVYQPQYGFSRGQATGAEALLRWEHPKWGAIAPSEFIPIAEQTGHIVPIGQWVIAQVARQIREWEDSGLSGLTVAINVSAIQFIRAGFVEDLSRVISEVSVPPDRIEVEITEAVALKDPEQAVAIIQRLHLAGFQIALDDFGTGYSSLSYLRRYAIDKLKIDQSFVNELTASQSDQSIVTAIIKMAHSLGMTTIAEGVETQEQARLLQALGCDELQGYWLSRPISAAEFSQKYQEDKFKLGMTVSE